AWLPTSQLDQTPSVHVECRSGDELGVLGPEKGDRGGDVLRLAYVRRVDLLDSRLNIRIVPEHAGVDRTRQDGVAADPLRLALDRSRAGQAEHGRLGRGIGRRQGLRLHGVDTGNV